MGFAEGGFVSSVGGPSVGGSSVRRVGLAEGGLVSTTGLAEGGLVASSVVEAPKRRLRRPPAP